MEVKVIQFEFKTRPLTAYLTNNKVYFRIRHIADILGVGDLRKSLTKNAEDRYISLLDICCDGYGIQSTQCISLQGLAKFLKNRGDTESLLLLKPIEKKLLPYYRDTTLFAEKFAASGNALVRFSFKGEQIPVIIHNDSVYFEINALSRASGIPYQSVYHDATWQKKPDSGAVCRFEINLLSMGKPNRLFVRSDGAIDLLAKKRSIGKPDLIMSVRSWIINTVMPRLLNDCVGIDDDEALNSLDNKNSYLEAASVLGDQDDGLSFTDDRITKASAMFNILTDSAITPAQACDFIGCLKLAGVNSL